MQFDRQDYFPTGGGSWLTVDVYGNRNGPGLMIVPGALNDAEDWQGVAKAVTAWSSVSIINRPGRHPSGPLVREYSLQTEIDDLTMVLRKMGNVQTLFGWSYGGLIALHSANHFAVEQVVAYDAVMQPFGANALPALKVASEREDWDTTLQIIQKHLGGATDEQIEALRGNAALWEKLCRLAEPAYAELVALNAAPDVRELAVNGQDVSLLFGQTSRALPVYQKAFEQIETRVPRAKVLELAGQGHLAHLHAPDTLASLLDDLGPAASHENGG